MDNDDDRTRKRVKRESVIHNLADAQKLNSRCLQEKATKEREVEDLNYKLQLVDDRKADIRRKLRAQKAEIDETRRNLDDIESAHKETENEYKAAKQEIEEIEVQVKKKEEELHWSVGMCQASDAFLNNFESVEEEEAIQQSSISGYSSSCRSDEDWSIDSRDFRHDMRETKAKREVSSDHLHAAEKLGVLLLGDQNPGNKSKERALEQDLEWYLFTCHGRQFKTIKSNERNIDTFQLLRTVFLSGGFNSFNRGPNNLSWNELCAQVGVNKNTGGYFKKWYEANVHDYELKLLEKVKESLRRTD